MKTAATEQAHETPVLIMQRASGVRPRPLRFLVPNVLPLGKLVLLAGKGSLGKSTITSDIAARLSRGEPAMGLVYSPIVGETIFATCEDGEEDTLVPRLLAAGADLDRIHFLRGVGVPSKAVERPTPWSLAHHAALENTLKENRNIRLLVIDPANAFAGRAGIDGHNDAELRSLLGPLADVASAHGVTVLLVTHTRKADCASAVEKVMGSVGWVNAVRAAWMVMHAPPPAKEKLLLPIKCNLWKDARGFVYQTVPLDRGEQELALATVKGLDDDDWNTLASQLYRVEWMGDTDADADTVLAEASKQQRGNTKADPEKAAEWLAEFLAIGPAESERCVREGNAALGTDKAAKWWRGILKEHLHGKPRLHGFGKAGTWYFTLPDGQWPPPEKPTDPESASLSSLDSLYEESAENDGDFAEKPEKPSDAEPASLQKHDDFLREAREGKCQESASLADVKHTDGPGSCDCYDCQMKRWQSGRTG